jgi:HSP20 family protein
MNMNESLRFPESIFAEFDRLQQQLDQSLRRANVPANLRGVARGTFPAVNVGSTPETFEVVAFAPGIDPKSLQLSIDKGLLIIVGERKNEMPGDDEHTSIYAQERFAGPFRRVVTLPEDADAARVDASYRDGCLRVSVRKLESSKPRQIHIH